MSSPQYASPTADAPLASILPNTETSGIVSTFVSRAMAGMSAWTVLATIMLALVLYDQCRYIWNKGSIEGPWFKIPFMGPFLESIYPDFNKYVDKWNSGELSCVSVFHKFVVIASTRDMARKVLTSPAYVKPCVVDVAHKLLRPTNWVFLDGRAHVEYRKGLNGLFTRTALELYLSGQEETYDRFFQMFLDISAKNEGKPVPFMPTFRELNCAVSCRTFVGHYLSDETVKRIADEYFRITAALDLVNFPIIIPFTRTYYGKKAADMVLEEFAKCAAKCKVRMRAGGEVTCIMDGWVKNMVESEEYRKRVAKKGTDEGETKPAVLLREFTDYEISQTIFTFLFASQDASSSATTWLFQLMANRPEILAKVREENLRLRDGDRNRPITMDMLEKMRYTRAVIKETLRYRPPVLMVPYEVKKDFPISPNYSVPKGSMVVPTLYPALHDPEVYPDPETFDPDRWITGDAEKASKNWLVFGTGPHYCLGQTYAQYNLMAMIGKASLHLNWEHHPTPLSEKIKVFATIFPQDDCPLVFSPRAESENETLP
ncbi:MAG: exocyst complex component exo70 [Watsoniomyces obsoletus]|nr:MAG: exocyst complex component exo70 [Watsoniomyces obsoletus]